MLKIRIQLFADNDADDDIEKNYLDQIDALKKQMESMVPGAEYNRVLEEHKRLTNEYINKRTPEKKEEPKARKAIEIIKDLQNENNSKVEHVRLSLEYRDAYIKEVGKDPWMGGEVKEDEVKNIVEAYKHLLENYGDNPSEFTYRFDELLRDDPQVVAALRMKNKAK